MKLQSCVWEEQTSAAVANGTIPPEVVTHAQRCSVCADILLVGNFLRDDALCTPDERLALPQAGLIWRKAQQKAAEQSLRLALRPIRWMTAIACIVFACSPWLRLILPLVQDLGSSWSRALNFDFVSFSNLWPATSTQPFMLIGLSGTMILLALGSWLMLRQE
jgi:hypothetical protein